MTNEIERNKMQTIDILTSDTLMKPAISKAERKLSRRRKLLPFLVFSAIASLRNILPPGQSNLAQSSRSSGECENLHGCRIPDTTRLKLFDDSLAVME